MEVLNEDAVLLSNYEVLELLRNVKHDRANLKSYATHLGENKGHAADEHEVQNRNTIIYETLEYLEQTPCSSQFPEAMQDFLTSIKSFSLTKAEKLQLLNLRPTSLVEVQLIIEEAEERLSEDKMNELLEIVAQLLPPPIEKTQEPEQMEEITVEDDDT